MAGASKDVYVVIVAGGTGTRLWPRSRKKRPKQFLNIFDDKSFILQVYQRTQKIVKPDHVFIVAPENYSEYIKQYLPEFPLTNFMGEPVKKGTTAAYGYTATYIKQLDPDAVLHIIAADDFIVDEAKYANALSHAAKLVEEKDSLVIYGVKPADPNTGYGYVQVLLPSKAENGLVESYLVKSFHEKPDLATAQGYLQSGDYFWHVFGFTVSIGKLLSLIDQFDPPTGAVLKEIEADMKLPSRLEAPRLAEHYEKLVESDIDTKVLEKSNLATYMVRLEDSWSDVGTWDHVYNLKEKDTAGNVIVGDKGKVLAVEVSGSIVIPGGKPIALVGVKNLVVVDAGDIMLICDKTKAQDVKKLINLLKEKKLDQYL